MRKIRYPLIVSDFDGTLVSWDGSITQENKRAIAEYIAAGGRFVLSTGRLPRGILSRMEEVGLRGVVSCCQGAVVLRSEEKEVLLEGALSTQTAVAACKKMEELDLHIHAYGLWDFYCNRDDEALKTYEKLVKVKCQLILDEPLSNYIERTGAKIYKLMAMVEPSRANYVLSELQKARLTGCAFTKSADFMVEVVHEKYSKGTAIEFLAEYFGVEVEDTVAIGDQLNDISMIERAGVGVAVQNADETLKACADYVCERTNEESAVAEVIAKFGFYGEN